LGIPKVCCDLTYRLNVPFQEEDSQAILRDVHVGNPLSHRGLGDQLLTTARTSMAGTHRMVTPTVTRTNSFAGSLHPAASDLVRKRHQSPSSAPQNGKHVL
jgi:hypothetical protein